MSGDRALVMGFAVTGAAVGRALVARNYAVVAVDDEPDAGQRTTAAELGIELVSRPAPERLAELVTTTDLILPTPGLPDDHPLFAEADRTETPVVSELDLGAEWDDRPMVAVTGTNGKTTVTTLVTEMLLGSGVKAVMAGNTDVPLVSAIDDPETEIFVVEASSFRLRHVDAFAPQVATWLNFAPDHLDVHRSLDAYEQAKAAVWARHGPEKAAVAAAGDAVVARHAPSDAVTFGDGGDFHRANGTLESPAGPIAPVGELWRALPHDIDNALAAAATASAAGATAEGVAGALRSHRGLPHRVERVAEGDGIVFYDDSKATTPHATIAAVRGFESVVLIAGGRNKGVDLSGMAAVAERLRGVVAIGDAAAEIVAALGGATPSEVADSMERAVALATARAERGDVVLLSPGCASFDWYSSYAERGDDFAHAVRRHLQEDGS